MNAAAILREDALYRCENMIMICLMYMYMYMLGRCM